MGMIMTEAQASADSANIITGKVIELGAGARAIRSCSPTWRGTLRTRGRMEEAPGAV